MAEFCFNTIKVIVAALAALLIAYPALVSSKSQFVQPLNSGMQMAIPYDLANVFIRPIAGSIATFLSIALWFILVFGVITSPFGYMFGIPSRKYVLGGPIDFLHSQTAPRSMSTDPWTSFSQDRWSRSTFADSLLFTLPDDIEGKDCNELLLCYAHGLFKKMPTPILKLYRLFSRRLLKGDETTLEAIKVGLNGPKACDLKYTKCEHSRFKLAVKVLKMVFRGNGKS